MFVESIYPQADAGSVRVFDNDTSQSKPSEIGPVFDVLSSALPLAPFDVDWWEQNFSRSALTDGTSPASPRPEGLEAPYLYPMLTRNERFRLSILWYYTSYLKDNEDVVQRLREKVKTLQSIIGWEFVICGLLENNVYRRVATAGVPLAILPRREATCAHTVQYSPGSIMFIPDMSCDWRFKHSPHVEIGGLRSYAGTPLWLRASNGENVSLGSLCVASNSPNQKLSQTQQGILVKFAEMIMGDIVQSSSLRRAHQQREYDGFLQEATLLIRKDPTDDVIMHAVKQAYPGSNVEIINLNSDRPMLGQYLLPPALAEAEGGILEDQVFMDELLTLGNHRKLEAERPVRAIISKLWARSPPAALVVSTSDTTRIYDDIDVRFVRHCGSLLTNVAQERLLKNAIQARERFMRGVTHQLRTPIHGILGLSDWLSEELVSKTALKSLPGGADAGETIESALNMIKTSSQDLMSTVNNLIKFNRWAGSSYAPNSAGPSNLDRLEHAILEGISQLASEEEMSRVSIFFDNRIEKEITMCGIDFVSLVDCLQPLILNAIQNTKKGSVVIKTSAPADYTSITFDVQDTGAGIAPGDHQRIFDAYEKVNGHSKGGGLGLTLACEIADALDGTVSLLSSEVGHGSCFRAQFRNPGFSCSSHRTTLTMSENTHNGCFISPPDSNCALTNGFSHFLTSRGWQTTDTDDGKSIAIVPFSSDLVDFEHQLTTVKARIIISLVPADHGFSVPQTHTENVRLCSGPFTSRLLNHILAEIVTGTQTRTTSRVPYRPARSSVSIPESPDATHDSDSVIARSFPLHCLLVDDNLINLRIISVFCKRRGFSYETARDGLQAVEKFRAAVTTKQFDLILLDLQMPNCDGIEACKRVRAFESSRKLRPTPVYIITGQDSPTDKSRSFAAGANKFFVKPLSLKKLDEEVTAHFDFQMH